MCCIVPASRCLTIYELPQARRAARGKPMVNLLPLAEGERITAILPIKSRNREGQRDGRGELRIRDLMFHGGVDRFSSAVPPRLAPNHNTIRLCLVSPQYTRAPGGLRMPISRASAPGGHWVDPLLNGGAGR
jgi:hypothetical protein